jgi:hypothetical protein
MFFLSAATSFLYSASQQNKITAAPRCNFPDKAPVINLFGAILNNFHYPGEPLLFYTYTKSAPDRNSLSMITANLKYFILLLEGAIIIIWSSLIYNET